jgi:hypothetical protein
MTEIDRFKKLLTNIGNKIKSNENLRRLKKSQERELIESTLQEEQHNLAIQMRKISNLYQHLLKEDVKPFFKDFNKLYLHNNGRLYSHQYRGHDKQEYNSRDRMYYSDVCEPELGVHIVWDYQEYPHYFKSKHEDFRYKILSVHSKGKYNDHKKSIGDDWKYVNVYAGMLTRKPFCKNPSYYDNSGVSLARLIIDDPSFKSDLYSSVISVAEDPTIFEANYCLRSHEIQIGGM